MSGPGRGANGMGPLPAWADLEPAVPQVTATMRRYLTQIGCVLRPGSVNGADLALRSFAAFLAETAPEITCLAQVTRRHIEDYKPWLARRPGQNKPRVTTATIAHRLGTLRMFFVRLDEWGWDEAPPRVPMFPGDLPRQDHPLPRALDDGAAARLLRAAQNDNRLLVRVTVEVLLRTGLRVSEYTSLRADAVVHIGAGPWLHVPVGKLREDRYLPLHPHLVALIDDYCTAHVAAGNPLLLPRENGKPADRHAVTRYINKAGAAAGLPHIHPHQLRHTLATQAINRGMSLEAIAAMLGHRSLDMTLRYANPRVLHQPGGIREVCPGTKGCNEVPRAQHSSFVTWGYAGTSPPDARFARQPGKIIRIDGPPWPKSARAGPAHAHGANLRVRRPDGLEEHHRGDGSGAAGADQLRHSDGWNTRVRQ